MNMTRQDDGTKAIDGQKPIGEQHQAKRKRGLECPACRLKIWSEGDHERDCPNGDWDRGDVMDHIMKEADRHNARERERQKRQDDYVDKDELYGSGWPR